MEHIYIVSETGNTMKHKLGVHSGSQHKLLQRYQTYLVNPTINFFMPIENARKYEKLCHKALQDTGRSCYRENTERTKPSEWYWMNIHDMLEIVNPILAKANQKKSLENTFKKTAKQSEKKSTVKQSEKKSTEKKSTVVKKTVKPPRKTIRSTINNYNPEDYDTWPKKTLVTLCGDLGIAKSGTKPELVDRIKEEETKIQKAKKKEELIKLQKRVFK